MTNFASLSFLFRFLPVFLAVYYLVPAKYRNLVLLCASLVFYAFGEPYFIVLLLALTFINYLVANRGYNLPVRASSKRKKQLRKRFMIEAVSLDVATLVLFKLLSVVGDEKLFPLGLSFYIFKMISFQIDVYRRNIGKRPSLTETFTYFTLFPQIMQGPIMRYKDGFFDKPKTVSFEQIEEGLKYFIIGFAMKIVLADRIGILWNDINMYGYESISTPLAWMGALAYSFELYFDFWGYSLMASGILVALGFDFIKNFDNPYASKSISEFYRRWHMTLGEFFKEYVYFPLGGSRCEKKKMIFNLAVVWLLTGLWHGNGVNFIVWGAVLGLFIILEKVFYGKKLDEHPVLGHVYTVFLIPLTWVIFAIGSLKDMGIYFSRLFPFFTKTSELVNSFDFVSYLVDYGWMFAVGIILCLPISTKLYQKWNKHWATTILLVILFWISIYYSAGSAGNPFMYLHF